MGIVIWVNIFPVIVGIILILMLLGKGLTSALPVVENIYWVLFWIACVIVAVCIIVIAISGGKRYIFALAFQVFTSSTALYCLARVSDKLFGNMYAMETGAKGFGLIAFLFEVICNMVGLCMSWCLSISLGSLPLLGFTADDEEEGSYGAKFWLAAIGGSLLAVIAVVFCSRI